MHNEFSPPTSKFGCLIVNSRPLSLMTTYRMSLISSGSILLDSTLCLLLKLLFVFYLSSSRFKIGFPLAVMGTLLKK
jgi:hypothetical protein